MRENNDVFSTNFRVLICLLPSIEIITWKLSSKCVAEKLFLKMKLIVLPWDLFLSHLESRVVGPHKIQSIGRWLLSRSGEVWKDSLSWWSFSEKWRNNSAVKGLMSNALHQRNLSSCFMMAVIRAKFLSLAMRDTALNHLLLSGAVSYLLTRKKKKKKKGFKRTTSLLIKTSVVLSVKGNLMASKMQETAVATSWNLWGSLKEELNLFLRRMVTVLVSLFLKRKVAVCTIFTWGGMDDLFCDFVHNAYNPGEYYKQTKW